VLFGSRILKNRTAIEKLSIGLIISICAIMLGGSAIYYFGTVNELSLSILLVIILLVASLISEKNEKQENKIEKRKLILGFAFIVSMISWWIAILNTQTMESIRSLWLIVDPRILIATAIAIAIIIITIHSYSLKCATIMLIILLASVLSIAFWIFPLGYGFDPFIHTATVEHIAQFGTISPKPFYYIGQYALELVALICFSLPINIVDGLLSPMLASILIPLSIFIVIKYLGDNWKMSLISIFLLPLSVFVLTTPQSLAFILSTCLVILSLPVLLDKIRSKEYLVFLFIITLAILCTHPLAGIPMVLFYCLVFESTKKLNITLHKIIVITLSLCSAIAVPLVFIAQSALPGLDIKISLTNILLEKLNVTGFFTNNYNAWLDGFYLVIDNYIWIIIALGVIGIYFAQKEKLNIAIYIYFYCALSSLVGFLILSLTLEFEFLIEYERSNYSDRLLTLFAIFVMPFVFITLSSIWSRIKNKNFSLKLAFVIIISLIGIAMIYGAYPRHDNYARSAGFNVSQADIDTVYAIDEYSNGLDYIVLANQAVSSAALKAFGFAKYYNKDIFYYPIPTGGKLYNYYLEMTGESGPDAQIIYDAMEYTGAETAFFVVNNYWWDSERIIEQSKSLANDWFALGDDEVTVFVFTKK
jgi:hypothetical protein